MKIFKNLVVSVACVVGAMEIGNVNVAGAGNLKRANSTLSSNQFSAAMQFAKDRRNAGHTSEQPKYVITSTTRTWPYGDPKLLHPDYPCIINAMLGNNIFQSVRGTCGNLLLIHNKEEHCLFGKYIILQSGTEGVVANELRNNLANNVKKQTTVWSGLDVIARVAAKKLKVPSEDILNQLKDLIEGLAGLPSADKIIDYLLCYIETVSGIIVVNDYNDEGVSVLKDCKDMQIFLNNLKENRNKLNILRAFLAGMNCPTAGDVNEIYYGSANVNSAIKKVKDLIYSLIPGYSDDNFPPNNIIRWFRYALHTEIQLAALLATQVITLQEGSPIFSVFVPCSSCELAAPIASWIDQEHRFISFHKDSPAHNPEKTRLQQYRTTAYGGTNSPYFFTIKVNE